MIRLLIPVLILSFSLSGTLRDSRAQELEAGIMSFNVWSGENSTAGRQRLTLIMQESNADIIGLQEMGSDAGQAIADNLGFFFHQQSGSGIQIISRYPIVGQSPQNFGALIEISPAHQIWVFNCHLPPFPYQPYDLRDGVLPMNEAAIISAAEAARGSQIDSVLADMSAALASKLPVFLVGDFNEPSHLDWTKAAANATVRPFDLQVDFPTSRKVTDVGLIDSFRAVRTDEVNDRGYTWTPGYPPPNLSGNEVHDRIDLVYFLGAEVTPLTSFTIGYDQSNPNTDVEISGYNSDHRAVVSTFAIDAIPILDQSELTFSGLAHNPGNDSALNAGGYGDRLASTPNVTLEFFATGTSHWDTYDGNFDNNGINNWNGGVGQLQYGSGSAEYDIYFVPDEGFGVLVEAFDLVDYINFAVGHTVNWELWSGEPDDDILLASGVEIVVADEINTVSTNHSEHEFGLLTLRIEHLAGDGTDLAIDNVIFEQAAKQECSLGDVNLDGQLNLLDVAPFVMLLTSAQFQCEADMNQDSSVDLLDVEAFVEAVTGN